MKVSGVIVGNLPSMKNSRELVTNHKSGKPMVIKSEKARSFVDDALLQITGEKRIGLTGKVRLMAYVYYRNQQSDLDVELFCDLLQKAGVIKNDNQIFEKYLFKFFDKTNPHVVWCVETME